MVPFISFQRIEKSMQALSKLSTEGYEVEAIDNFTGAPNEHAKQKALKTIAALPTMQTYGLPKKLHVKLGARYMITVNVDTSDGLVNGATGVLKSIEFGVHVETGRKRPLRLWILFDDESSGQNTRNKFPKLKQCHKQNINLNFTPIESVTYTIKRWKSSN